MDGEDDSDTLNDSVIVGVAESVGDAVIEAESDEEVLGVPDDDEEPLTVADSSDV